MRDAGCAQQLVAGGARLQVPHQVVASCANNAQCGSRGTYSGGGFAGGAGAGVYSGESEGQHGSVAPGAWAAFAFKRS